MNLPFIAKIITLNTLKKKISSCIKSHIQESIPSNHYLTSESGCSGAGTTSGIKRQISYITQYKPAPSCSVMLMDIIHKFSIPYFVIII